MNWWLNIEQRRALRTWGLVLAGPALLLAVLLIVAEISWGFGILAPATRINWLGTIAETLGLLISIVLLTFAAEISLRSFKGSAGGVSFEATGGDEAPAVTATVTNSAGDTATATVPTATGDSA